MCDPDHRGLTATSVFSRLSTLSSSKPKPKPNPIPGSYHKQSGGGGSAQQNVYPPARIILEGVQHRISDHDDGMGNITHARPETCLRLPRRRTHDHRGPRAWCNPQVSRHP